MGINFYDCGLGDSFLDITTKSQAVKEKFTSWTSYIKIFGASKDTIKKV